MKRSAWFVAATFTVVALSQSQAQATDGVGATSTEGGGSVAVTSGSDPGVGGGGAAGPAALPRCGDVYLTIRELSAGSTAWENADPATRPPSAFTPGLCDDGYPSDGPTQYMGLTPLTPPDPTLLVVAQAAAQLTISTPDVATSPPRGGTQLVGVPVWFWVRNTKPMSATAAIPGLSATITATPGPLAVEISGASSVAAGDNTTLHCPGSGTPYDANRHDPWSASTCSKRFNWNHPSVIRATVTWQLAWTATNGQTGTLPVVTRTTSFGLTIKAAQAVTD